MTWVFFYLKLCIPFLCWRYSHSCWNACWLTKFPKWILFILWAIELFFTFNDCQKWKKNYIFINRHRRPSEKRSQSNLLVDCQLHLFEIVVMPVLLYGGEVLGYEYIDIVERIHLTIWHFWNIQNLKICTTPHIHMVYWETGFFLDGFILGEILSVQKMKLFIYCTLFEIFKKPLIYCVHSFLYMWIF